MNGRRSRDKEVRTQRDVLIVEPDRQRPLVVLRVSLAIEIAEGTA